MGGVNTLIGNGWNLEIKKLTQNLIFPNGGKYVGGWKDGRRNGQGTFTLPDGGTYVGGWKDGKEHGHGTLTFPDGKRYTWSWNIDFS